MASALLGRTIVLGVTGSVAAYKAPILLRLLQKAGARVRVVLTEGAKRFVGAATFSGLAGEQVYDSMWNTAGEAHVRLAAEADAMVVAPATADFLARLASGRADDLLSATVLCARAPVFVAPAMHPSMWSHAATVRNVGLLKGDGVHFLGPVDGPVASGDTGLGRMMEPEAMVDELVSRLGPWGALSGKHVVVTAGPTFEALDPVRFLGNRSSGKMGFAVAEALRGAGAEVTLISGPVHLETPPGVARVNVRTALEMQAALRVAMGDDLARADAVVMAAAVADFRPATVSQGKIKKGDAGSLLVLERNPDLLHELGEQRHARGGASPVLVGFAVETGTDEQVLRYARHKLVEKKVDLIVANHADVAFEGDDNQVTLVTATGETRASGKKRAIARRIAETLAKRFAEDAR